MAIRPEAICFDIVPPLLQLWMVQPDRVAADHKPRYFDTKLPTVTRIGKNLPRHRCAAADDRGAILVTDRQRGVIRGGDGRAVQKFRAHQILAGGSLVNIFLVKASQIQRDWSPAT